MSENTSRKSLLQTFLQSSVIATALAGLFTTVVGGYLLDRSRDNSLELDRERTKQEALITNQLSVLESLNKLLAEYKLAAEFVIYDLVERDGATLDDQQAILKSITDYDRAARAFLSSAYGEVFRVRIYFADPKLCEELDRRMTRLNTPGNLIAIDGALSVQIAEYKRRSPSLKEAQAKPRIRTIGLARGTTDLKELQDQLANTRSALRIEFAKIKTILEKLADSTVAKR